MALADGTDIDRLLTLARTKGWPVPRYLENRPAGPLASDTPVSTVVGSARSRELVRPLQPLERCFLAKVGGEIVHYSWIREGGCIDYFLEPLIETMLGSDEVYFHTAYTPRAWRGKMIHSAVLRGKLIYAREAGFRKAYGLVNADNISSRKGVERLGWQVAARTLFFVGRQRRDAFVWVISDQSSLSGKIGRRVRLVRV